MNGRSDHERYTINTMYTLRNLFWSIFAALLLSAGSVAAADVVPVTTGTNFTLQSPLKNIGGIDQLVKVIIDSIVMPLGMSVAVVFIIYSGFLYVKAQGKPEEIKKAHKALTWTIVGTAVLLGAWVIAQLIGGTIDQLRTL